MCPKGYFADGFAARFGSDSRATLGFNGLHLRCRTITLSDTAFISDSYHNYPLSDFYSPEVGNFITAVRIKYLNS
jgi:hypothetical protein